MSIAQRPALPCVSSVPAAGLWNYGTHPHGHISPLIRLRATSAIVLLGGQRRCVRLNRRWGQRAVRVGSLCPAETTAAEGLPPFYCECCRMTCTSRKALEQHLQGKRHLKKARQLTGAAPVSPVRPKKKKAQGPEVIGKKVWNKLIRAENFQKLFEAADEDANFPHQRLVDLLKLSAAKGGPKEFADVLWYVAKDNEKFDLKVFHKILDTLLMRVPTPCAMVRLLLNFAVQKPEDMVPLVPPTIGFGRGKYDEFAEREELVKLFRGCQAVGTDETDALDHFQILQKVQIEELLQKVDLPDSRFEEYYPRFLILLVLDFMEELAQNQDSLDRTPESLMAYGRLVPEMTTEVSENGKSLVCWKAGVQKFEGGDSSLGRGVLLCTAGSDPLRGGALSYGRIEMVGMDASGLRLILNVGGKNEVRQLDQKRRLDIYSSVNLIAFERQLEALTKVCTTLPQKRFPLWDLLPVSGVGGDILDSWAARMRDAVTSQSKSRTPSLSSDDSLDDLMEEMDDLGQQGQAVEAFAAGAKLESLAKRVPPLSLRGQMLLKDFRDFLDGQDSRCDQDICEAMTRLNTSQQDAVEAAISRQLTVIQGPPGTGKTHVSVEILRLWSRMGIGPVLVTSHNNIAVDNIAEKAYAAGLKVVRLAKGDRISPELDACSLNTILDEEYPFLEYSDKSGRYDACQRILDDADAICVTTISSASNLVSGKNRKFGAILMDEAAQTTELSALVPLANVNAARLVLVGDHCQLPATALSLEAETRGLTLSLFQRLVSRGLPAFFLDTQFRMHPSIAEHSAMEFYGGKLRTGVKPQHRLPPLGFDWPVEGEGVALLDTQRMADKGETRDRASWCNPSEAFLLSEVLRCVLKEGELQPSQVGVVTPYMGQVRRLRRAISQNLSLANGELLVASVDSFQGREKELILFSAVRSNPRRTVGFLADWRRLNVMITRARRGLVIVGDMRTLKKDPAWSAYIGWAKDAGYLRQI